MSPNWLVARGSVEDLKDKRTQIRKVVYRDQLQTADPQSKKIYARLLYRLTGHIQKQDGFDAFYRSDFDFRPSEDELTQIIEKHLQDDRKDCRVGFIFAGDASTVHWLDNGIVKRDPELNVDRAANGLFDGSAMLKAIISNRDDLLSDLTIET